MCIRDRAGAGSAVNDTTREIGGTLGVAVLGSILTSAYVAGIADRLSGRGLPREAVDVAEQSVMAGVEVARQLPGTLGDAVQVAVQEVFMDGLHDAVWAAVAITAAAGVAALLLLRGTVGGHRGAAGEAGPAGVDTDIPATATASEVEGEVPARTP